MGAKAIRAQYTGAVVSIGKGVVTARLGSAAVGAGCDSPVLQARCAIGILHQGIVGVGIFQHQHLAETVVAVFDQAHFQIRGRQGLVEVSRFCQVYSLTVTFGVYALDLDIETAGPFFLALKRKSFLVDV